MQEQKNYADLDRCQIFYFFCDIVMFVYPTYQQAVVWLAQKLLSEGKPSSVFASQDTTVNRERASIYGDSCVIELRPCVVTIEDASTCFLPIPGRRSNPESQRAEIKRMMSGSDRLDEWFAPLASPALHKFADNGVLHGAYGPRMFRPCDQLAYCIELLRDNPASRSAVIDLWNSNLDSQFNHHHKPCITSWMLQIVDEKVTMTVMMRACDILKGFTAINMMQSAYIQSHIAIQLGREMGSITMMTPTLHYYASRRERVEELVRNKIEMN